MLHLTTGCSDPMYDAIIGSLDGHDYYWVLPVQRHEEYCLIGRTMET